MPTYTYECFVCHERQELQSSIADRDNLRWHRHRGTTGGWVDCSMKRVPDAPAIAFKGSGFYVNDYRRKT